MKKGTRFYSIMHCTCPRCQETSMFSHKPSYHFTKMTEMPERCSNCGLEFTPEPGYYYGAMYVSYAFAIAEFVALLVATHVLFSGVPIWLDLVLVTFCLVVMMPFNFRWGRSGWINLFYRYDKKYSHG